MIEFEKRTIKPEYNEDHIRSIVEYMERNLTRELGPKAETGSTRSESGYQRIAASTCGSIARSTGCSVDRAKMLSMSVGVGFPKYGHEGLKVIKQYIIGRNIDINLDTLGLDCACYYISSHRYRSLEPIVASHVYDLLYDYYSGEDNTQESKIVRLVQNTILDIKKAEKFYEGHPGDLLFDATQELINLAKEHKCLMKGTMLGKYSEQISSYCFPTLTEEERKETYDRLDHLVDVFSNHPEHLADLDITPEEVVLKYITSGILCQ